LPIQPVCAGSVNVCILGSLVAATEQQDHLSSGDSVIDSVSWADVDAHLPDPIAAKLVIAEVAQFHPVYSAVNSDFRLRVAELATPFHEGVFLAPGQIVANLVHNWIIVYKRNSVKWESLQGI
jgi:hypothetical protein